MNQPQKNSVVSDQNYLHQDGETEILSEQQISPTLELSGFLIIKGRDSSFSTEIHWTVKNRVKMEKRTASILLKCLVFETIIKGLDFTGYLAVEHLVSFILGTKQDALEIRDEKDRQAVMLGLLLLASIRGSWITLDERIQFPPETQESILGTGWLPDKRTFLSWKNYHNPRSFLEVYTVPMSIYSEIETNRPSERYSGYTKGYGNGGHLSRIQKTPFSSELDGTISDQEPPRFNLLEIDRYSQLLFEIERQKKERQLERK